MLEILAKQSIDTKLKLESATMLGNYEFYYAAGIVCREFHLTVEEDIQPKALYDFIMEHSKGKQPDNHTVTHLLKMIRYYIPDDAYDEQMKSLLLSGMGKR